MSASNLTYGFMGGMVEQVQAGSFMADEPDGSKREVIYTDHILVTSGRKKAKLNGSMVIGIVTIYKDNPEFRKWCESCLV